MEVEIDSKKLERIEKCLSKGTQFKTIDQFVDHAITLLLYAEENKDMFQKLMKGN